jgi:hypothetical protein
MKSIALKYTIALNKLSPVNEENKGCKDIAHVFP